MAGEVLNKYSPLVDCIMKESGEKSSPIWLLLNPKFPAVRQDIWAPILEVIQDKVYRSLHRRIDTQCIFIKNVVSDTGIVGKASNRYASDVAKEIMMLRESLLKYQPRLLFTFGSMTDELVRRLIEIRNDLGSKYWRTANLGKEFERSIAGYDIRRINRIPLPCRILKNGNFVEDRNYFTWEENEDYFQYVGTKIAGRIIESKDSLRIWIK